ncbi:MAG: hypothetical protein DRN12_02670 [Thermoplasmata archaeon]|nr:MAG: hypothetical protein DRN12_02670 [Thermoplasmata archaeon]
MYDVIVVGAGPAGSTASRYLSKSGLKVLLLDKNIFPRRKTCAGGLCRHIESFPYIHDILKDKSLIKSVCRGSITISPSGRYEYSYISSDPLFYNVFREEFDSKLVDLAVDMGTEFRDNTLAKDVNVISDGTVEIYSSNDIYRCKVAIIADGALGVIGSYIRKKIGVEKWWRNNLDIAVASELKVDEGFIDRIYGVERKAILKFRWSNLHGYAWVFPKRDTVNIGFGGMKDEMKAIDVQQEFNRYLSYLRNRSLLPKNITYSKVYGAPLPSGGPISKVYYSNILLAGDAAGFVSPLSGEGIYYAMESGRIASKVIISSFENDNFNVIGRNYQRNCFDSFGRNLKLLSFYKYFLMFFSENTHKYAELDPLLRRYYIEVFNGDRKALDPMISVRFIKDFLMFDIFQRR